ncbi:hypothetical protein PQX77_009180 [Marasmius sp. AFHP31]|nr:hypothetical protein PQX77_009180 [Marasmius sp. AFHP31]
MHHIFVKDQMTLYDETPAFIESNNLIFGGGLLGTRGEPHRRQRKVLNPVFSIANMRDMLPIFYQIGHKLQHTLAEKVKSGPTEIDMLTWMSRTALELIGQAGLGHSFDNLEDEEHAHPYIKTIKQLAPFFARAFFIRSYIVPHLAHIGTPRLRLWASQLLPYVWKDFARAKNFSEYMWKVSKEIFEDKKAGRCTGPEELAGKDIISRLINENEKVPEEDRLTEDELIGQVITLMFLRLSVIDPCSVRLQVSTLTFAAMDTTSTALARMLTLLASHPDVQKKLREEVQSVFGNGDISYDQLISLPYLDAISRETLRMYPPVHRLMRRTLQDVSLPLSTPVTCTDGTVVNDIFLPRNTDIFVSVHNSNRNKAYWGNDADEWKPERWLSPLPDTLLDAKIPGIYSHLMTFNAGGRSCIGFKFSQLEMKVVLALLIQTFEFAHSEKEIAWRATGVSSPVVIGPEGKGRPEMPMLVNLVKKDL